MVPAEGLDLFEDVEVWEVVVEFLDEGKKTVECANCKGKGKVDKGGFLNTNWKPCDVCNGSGKVKCPSCGG